MRIRRILLTGGSGDTGAAIIKYFEEKGDVVYAPSRTELDLQFPAQIERFVSTLTASKNEIDAFIHCAGINIPKSFSELADADIQETMQVNAFSFFSLSQALIRNHLLKKPGAIVGISSLYGDISRRSRLAYCASKHALNGMIKTLAIELGEMNISVNGVAPGFVDTQMTRKNNHQHVIQDFINKIPLRRLATPQDIAETVYFLCSPTQYIHGQIIVVDGGYSIGGFQG